MDEAESVTELVQDLLGQALPRSTGSLGETCILGAQPMNGRDTDLAAELRGAEDMGEDRKVEVN